MPPTASYTLSLHDALPISLLQVVSIYSPKNTHDALFLNNYATINIIDPLARIRDSGSMMLMGSEEHTSALQSRRELVCGLLLDKKDTEHRHDEEGQNGILQ